VELSRGRKEGSTGGFVFLGVIAGEVAGGFAGYALSKKVNENAMKDCSRQGLKVRLYREPDCVPGLWWTQRFREAILGDIVGAGIDSGSSSVSWEKVPLEKVRMSSLR